MLMLHALVLGLVTTAARLAFLVGATTASSDNVGSIRVTEAQRGRSWLGFNVSHSVQAGTYAYPPLIYWLVSRLPRAWWTRARYWANYLADAASTLLVWVALRTLTPALPAEVHLLAALAFGLNPLFLPTVEHARITSPNARSLGLLLNTVWIGVLVACLSGHDPRWALALIPLAWVIILTSQFGMQTMVGLTVLTAAAAGNPWPVLALITAGVSGWYVPRLGIREVLRHKFAHWRWYRIVQRSIVNAAGLRARPWRERTAAMAALFRRPVHQGHALGHALQTSAWWKMAAGTLPLLVAVLYAGGAGVTTAAVADPVVRALVLVCAAALVLFVLTTLPALVFLGEAERYVEHSMAAFTVLSVSLVASAPALAMPAVTLGLVLTLGTIVAQLAHRQWPAAQSMMGYPQIGFAEERALLRFLLELGQPVRIATVPVKAAFLLHDLLIDESVPGNERIQFYFQHVLQQSDDRFAYLIEDTTDGYTYLKPDLEGLVERYGITTMVVDTMLLNDPTNQEPILQRLRTRKPMHSGRFTTFSLHDLQARRSVTSTAVEPVADVEPAGAQTSDHDSGQIAAIIPSPSVMTKRRPRILAIADVPQWIFERHARELRARLHADYDVVVQYMNDPIDEQAFDLIYPLEFTLVRPELISAPWKYVTAVRSHVSWDYMPVERLTAFLATRFQRTHVVSRRLRALLAPTLPGVEYVTHGFDGARFQPTARLPRAGALRLGWAGNRQTPAKGFEEFVRPLAAMPGVELVICGYSDRNRTLDEMPAYYASLDAYICTSDTEGNNNTLLEAAGTGTPIITTRTGTVSEYLRDGESALIIPRQLPAVQAAVAKLRDTPGIRTALGDAAARAVHPAWTWSERIHEYRTFFDAALAGRGEARARMERDAGLRQAAGHSGWSPLPARPTTFDLIAAMTFVQQAVADGRVADAIAGLERLVQHDDGNPAWPMLLAELTTTTV
jgi:glycosyltransferase involved in cell wall biosynthesis